MIHLFPYLLCRVGGESLSLIQPRQTLSLDHLIKTLTTQQAACLDQKEALSNDLLTYLREQEGTWQKQVHNFRRDIYNDRPVKPAVETHLLAQLPVALGTQIQLYRTCQQAMTATRLQWETTYKTALLTHRAEVQVLAQHETLRQGLALSSPDLVAQLDKFGQVDPPMFRKRENNTEQSLLKYLSRMVAKTSPFSTFTNLTIGRFNPAASSPYAISGEIDAPVEGHVRLNNFLYKIVRDLLWTYQPIVAHLTLRPNPTLRQQAQSRQWVYLTNVNNAESFQRLPVQPVPNAILNLLQPPATLTFGQLVAELGELVDADVQALEAFVRQLIEFGFLEMVWPSSGMDPNWDIALVDWLEQIAGVGVPLAMDLAQGLTMLRQQASRFATVSSQTRMQLLETAHTDFRALYWRIHEAAGLPAEERRTPEEMIAAHREAQQKAEIEKKVAPTTTETQPDSVSDSDGDAPDTPPADSSAQKPVQPFRYKPFTVFTLLPRQLFYEDTTRPLEAVLPTEALQAWTTQLDYLNHCLGGGIWSGKEQATMRDFFQQQYPGQPTVPLLTFYEDYSREVELPAEEKRRQEKEQSAKREPVPPSSPPAKASGEPETPGANAPNDQPVDPKPKPAFDSLDEQLYQFCLTQLEQQARPDALTIADTDLALVLTTADVTLPPPSAPASRATFVQFYAEEDRLVGVINTMLTGWGRLFSRFLHILDPDVLEAQRHWNAQFASGLVLTECVDASYFNANIHPPLMPHELQLPNGHTSLPLNQQLLVSDFHLQLVGDGLQLVHAPSGQPAYCFDLGFQGPAGRSPLFRLVTQFALPGFSNAYRLTHAANRAAVQRQPVEGIRQFPRVTFNQQIVVQRRHWRIRNQDSPSREPLETDAAYALRIRLWCQQYGIPNEVFVTINEERSGYPSSGERALKLTRDDYKPQYVDFAHPLLVLLFEKLLIKAPGGYRIDEMLPGPDQVTKLGGKPFVSECLVQWYTHQPQ